MSSDKYLFCIYKQYLIFVANKQGRGFTLPKNDFTFQQRNDHRFFKVLGGKFKEKRVPLKKINIFFEVAGEVLLDTHISDVVDSFDEIYAKYKSIKEDTVTETKRNIKKGFDNIVSYCIIKEITDYEVLLRGSPPPILRLWKEGKINEKVLLSLYDISKVSKKPWFMIYGGDLSRKAKKIIKDINKDVHLNSYIESEKVKIKSVING